MDKFNGVSGIELEMIKDEIKNAMPLMMIYVAPVAQMTIASYIALSKENDAQRAELNKGDLIQAAVNSAIKQIRGS